MVSLRDKGSHAARPAIVLTLRPRERKVVRSGGCIVGLGTRHRRTTVIARTGSTVQRHAPEPNPPCRGPATDPKSVTYGCVCYGAPVRIVAGTARGRRIEAPEGRITRPTLDRVRQAIFNALDARELVRDAVVLDLFGGSGALALEAISRGATGATVVEADRAAVTFVRRNAEALGFADDVRVFRSDVLRWLVGGGANALQPTLVLADPPYEWSNWPELFASLPASVDCVVAETGVPLPAQFGWDVEREKRYGGTIVTMLVPAKSQRADEPSDANPQPSETEVEVTL